MQPAAKLQDNRKLNNQNTNYVKFVCFNDTVTLISLSNGSDLCV